MTNKLNLLIIIRLLSITKQIESISAQKDYCISDTQKKEKKKSVQYRHNICYSDKIPISNLINTCFYVTFNRISTTENRK